MGRSRCWAQCMWAHKSKAGFVCLPRLLVFASWNESMIESAHCCQQHCRHVLCQ